jgi:hypothetical protein
LYDLQIASCVANKGNVLTANVIVLRIDYCAIKKQYNDGFKMIDKFKCQKASCRYRGRDYIAFFCSDIPFNYGPWKLNGLPGLILEAYDTKSEISFKFSNLAKSDIIVQMPIKYKIINELEFEKMKLNDLNTDSFSNSYMSVSVEIKDSKGEIIQKKVLPINNPIDLLTKLPYTF